MVQIGQCKRCGEVKPLTREYCKTKCYSYLRKHGILAKLPQLESPPSLTERQHEVLVGFLLGDGCLYRYKKYRHGKYEPHLSIGRQAGDKAYLQHNFLLFREFCNQTNIRIHGVYDKRTQKTYDKCNFSTRPSSAFRPYHDNWYDNVKRLPEKLELTPLTCAIWFCDDGSVLLNKKTNRLRLKLSTHSFTKEENNRLASALKQMFGNAHFSVCFDDGNYFLSAADHGAKEFIRYIEQFIPLSMSRKIVWTEEHFEQPDSFAQLKNRDRFHLNDKEQTILKLLSTRPMNPKLIAAHMNWTPNKDQATPSGLFLYLKRFNRYEWVTKTGTPHSYKNPITYQLTAKGAQALTNATELRQKSQYR